ncbi:Na/Pi cotransporter family protein [Candidatus Aerophobetes bacterium]|nr:Na/Pi cotransporter family protein [Candidatus Aerophobetes bacterium]
MLEVFGTILAGLGLFFVGVKIISDNAKQMASRRLRMLVSKWINNGLLAGLGGALSGFVTQSTSVATFIVASLTSSGLMTVRKALPIIIWANAGCSVLVLLAVLDIKYVVLFMLSIAGICFAFDKPIKYRYGIGILFGIGLLFYGLQMIRIGVSPLAEFGWLQSFLYRIQDSYVLAFVVGAFLAFVSQTAIGIVIVAITMAEAGLFSVDQTIMLIYGVHVGSSITTWFLSSGLKGTPKQLVMLQVLFNFVGAPLFILMFYLEVYLNVPLVKRLVGTITPQLKEQMAYIVLLFNFGVPLVLSFFLNPFYKLLVRLCPPTEEEDLSKLQFIHDQALNDPETAMDLVEKEQLRLVKRLPGYLENVRVEKTLTESAGYETVHNASTAVATEVQSFLTALVDKNLSHITSERLLNLQNRHSLIISIEDNVYQLVRTIDHTECSVALQKFIHNVVEGLHTILLTIVDAMESSEKSEVDLLINITEDRGDLMEKIRRIYLTSDTALDVPDKSTLLYITNLYERIVWLIRRWATLLKSVHSLDQVR